MSPSGFGAGCHFLFFSGAWAEEIRLDFLAICGLLCSLTGNEMCIFEEFWGGFFPEGRWSSIWAFERPDVEENVFVSVFIFIFDFVESVEGGDWGVSGMIEKGTHQAKLVWEFFWPRKQI